jgi:hypothetical protein
MIIHLNVDTGAYLMKMVAAQKRRGQTSRTPFEAPGLAASCSAQHDCAVQPNVGTFSKNRMLPGACPPLQRLGGFGEVRQITPKLGGNES